MKTLITNVTTIFGKQGEDWIASLPAIVEQLAADWQLKQVTPVSNMTFNYVAFAVANSEQPVVLKIGCDKKSIDEERQALAYFNGNGSIQLIDFHATYHALLLHQAVPGTTLKSYYPSHLPFVMDCYIGTMQKLHARRLPEKHHYRPISDWLKAIDQLIPNNPCPSDLLEKAISLKNTLLSSMTSHVFLHGDLHHDNVLQDGDQWLAIDPKGIVGEPEFEIAAFDFMYINELANEKDVKNFFEKRVKLLAQKANLNPQRIKDWVFVRLILMAAWFIEDHGDPSWALKLARLL
jgi:streptomycin 6-kinase